MCVTSILKNKENKFEKEWAGQGRKLEIQDSQINLQKLNGKKDSPERIGEMMNGIMKKGMSL